MSRRNFSANLLPIVTLAKSGKSGRESTIKHGGMNSIASLNMSIFPAFARWNILVTWIILSKYWTNTKGRERRLVDMIPSIKAHYLKLQSEFYEGRCGSDHPEIWELDSEEIAYMEQIVTDARRR